MNRRQFVIKSSQAAALLSVLPTFACSSQKGISSGVFNDFGIQLWTLRDIIYANPKETIQQIGKMGFTQIESFEGNQGIFWGMQPKEFKSFLDGEGLNFVSSHCNWKENLAQKAADVASIGGKYLICPWLGPQKSIDDFKRYADEFNKAGEICKKEGVRFAYHNHDYSFQLLEGQIPQQIFLDNTDPELVDFEMDLYWVVRSGNNPLQLFNQHPGRFKMWHVKDMDKLNPNWNAEIGTGTIDFKSIFAQAELAGMKRFFLEHETNYKPNPIESAATSFNYIKKNLI